MQKICRIEQACVFRIVHIEGVRMEAYVREWQSTLGSYLNRRTMIQYSIALGVLFSISTYTKWMDKEFNYYTETLQLLEEIDEDNRLVEIYKQKKYLNYADQATNWVK